MSVASRRGARGEEKEEEEMVVVEEEETCCWRTTRGGARGSHVRRKEQVWSGTHGQGVLTVL